MLQVFVGDDRVRARAQYKKNMSALMKKRPDAEVVIVTDDTFDIESIKSMLEAQGLFNQKYIVGIEFVLGKKDRSDACSEYVSAMAQSENAFLILEEKVSAPFKKLVKKHAFLFEEYAEKKESHIENPFLLAEAFGNKDRKNLWVLFTKFLRLGVAVEELHGILVWQVKAILATYKVTNANEAHMKDFPFSKAKRYAKNFTEEEITAHYDTLITLYQDAHSGKFDLGVALERFVLTL